MVRHSNPFNLLISWLNDAYAMEQAQVPVLENHARDADHFPAVHDRIQLHAHETRRHAGLVKGCVERLGGQPSSLKAGIGLVGNWIKEAASSTAEDELVKNNLTDIAAEHFEIACYHSLMAAAQDLGEQEIARVCQHILREEEEMARWLEAQLPHTTVNVLHDHAAAQG